MENGQVWACQRKVWRPGGEEAQADLKAVHDQPLSILNGTKIYVDIKKIKKHNVIALK